MQQHHWTQLFEGVQDPRRSNATRHNLHEMLMIGLLSTLCGGQGCVDMERFGRAKEAFLRRFMELKHGIPSHDAFSHLFNALDPKSFHRVILGLLTDWASTLGDSIAIDGKALRRSFQRAAKRSPLHVVQAFASEARLMLGQVKVDDKSNEITALPSLLEVLDVWGRIVTADAMHTQRQTAALITQRGGDYVLALKGNQGTLYEDVTLYLDDARYADRLDVDESTDAGHGRIERRVASLSTDVAWLRQRHRAWPSLAAIGKVTARRESKSAQAGKKPRIKTRYYVLSTPMTAARFQHVVRSHWLIENALHWVLDVTLNEDQQRNRTRHGPENLALLRRLALNIARREPTRDAMRGKIKRAAWNDDFLLDLIRAAAPQT